MSGFEQQQDIGYTVQTTDEVDSNPDLRGLEGFFASILREEVEPYKIPESGTTQNSLPVDQGMADWINRSFADSPTPSPASANAPNYAPAPVDQIKSRGVYTQEERDALWAGTVDVSGAPQYEDGPNLGKFSPRVTEKGLNAGLSASRHTSRFSPIGLFTRHAQPTPSRYVDRAPAPIVPPESADPLDSPEKKPSRLRRAFLLGSAAVAIVGVAVAGVFALKSDKQVQPDAAAEQATTSTDLLASTTTMPVNTTGVPASIIPGAGEYKPTTTIAESTTTTAPAAPTQDTAPDLTQPTAKEVSSTLSLAVEKSDNLYDLIQEGVADRSDAVADKDPLVTEFTNEVLEIIAKQKGITRAQLNKVYAGNHFQAPLTPELEQLRKEIRGRFNLASNRTS